LDRDIVPSYIKYWTRAFDADNVCVTNFEVNNETSERSTPSICDGIIYVCFEHKGFLVNQIGGGIKLPYEINAWYHIEFRNVDWVNHTYDHYVDDSLISEDVSFLDPNASSIRSINLYHDAKYGAGSWDEIVMR